MFALATIATIGVPSPASPALFAAQPAASFRFETINSLEEMRSYVNTAFRVASPRSDLRRRFVSEGGATLVAHPSRSGVEKYLYDINLCGFYVWRWNVSADFDAQDRVRQIYVNGEPALADGQSEPAFDPAAARQPQTRIFRMSRPRPEASRGESSLGFVLMDADGDLRTTGDQILTGAGPTRPHPANMGRLHAYLVNPWRSIFDPDPAARIAPYSGDCAAAEQAVVGQTRRRR